jgi:hypothetical protein
MSTSQPTPLRPIPVTEPGKLRRVQPIEKAARLISEDRVMLAPDAQVYRVLGDSATYNVVASPDGIFCPCAARTPLCAHVLAVALIRQRGKPAPERLAQDLRVVS